MTNFSINNESYILEATSDQDTRKLDSLLLSIAIQNGIFRESTDVWISWIQTKKGEERMGEVSGTEVIEDLSNVARNEGRSRLVAAVVSPYRLHQKKLERFYCKNGFELIEISGRIFGIKVL